ncbi:hypothetical protein J4526_01325 [Desulfurococcaceae archaeon MEX13E-LK6-19]|nr:hypothetical protein J4526_01325 [Desulfurococcaceae archaeon MEX13E-LK6-19]
MMNKTRLLLTFGASVAAGIVAMAGWYFLVVLLANKVFVLPSIGGVNFTDIIISVRPYSPSEIGNNVLYLLGVFPIPGVLGLYMFFTVGLIGFLVPWAIVSGRVFKEMDELRRQVFEVLQLAAAYARTGVSLPDSLLNISETIGPPLGPRIRSYAMLIKVHTLGPIEAFNKVFGDLPRDLRTLLGILHIAVRGGRPSDVIRAAASLASNIRRFDETRMSRLSGTNAVIFVAVLAYAVTSIIMTKLMSIITSISQETGGAAGAAQLFAITMPIEHIMVIYYLSSLILAILGGLMIARVVKGTSIVAFRYHLIFFIIIFLCFLFLPPILGTII